MDFTTYAKHILQQHWPAIFDACPWAQSGTRGAGAATPEGERGSQAATIVQFSVYNWAGSNDRQVTLFHCGFYYNAAILDRKPVYLLFTVGELHAEGSSHTGISIRVRQFLRA